MGLAQARPKYIHSSANHLNRDGDTTGLDPGLGSRGYRSRIFPEKNTGGYLTHQQIDLAHRRARQKARTGSYTYVCMCVPTYIVHNYTHISVFVITE